MQGIFLKSFQLDNLYIFSKEVLTWAHKENIALVNLKIFHNSQSKIVGKKITRPIWIICLFRDHNLKKDFKLCEVTGGATSLLSKHYYHAAISLVPCNQHIHAHSMKNCRGYWPSSLISLMHCVLHIQVLSKKNCRG